MNHKARKSEKPLWLVKAEIDELDEDDDKEVVEEPKKTWPAEIEAEADKLAFFLTEPPKNIVEGITSFEYNLTKGVVGGTVLFVSAPWVCAVENACEAEVSFNT